MHHGPMGSGGERTAFLVDRLDTLNEKSQVSPAVASWNGHLHIAWTGRDRRLNLMSSPDGGQFAEKRTERNSTPTPATQPQPKPAVLRLTVQSCAVAIQTPGPPHRRSRLARGRSSTRMLERSPSARASDLRSGYNSGPMDADSRSTDPVEPVPLMRDRPAPSYSFEFHVESSPSWPTAHRAAARPAIRSCRSSERSRPSRTDNS